MQDSVAHERAADAKLTADGAPVLLWTTDDTGRCDGFNTPWHAFSGRTPEQSRGDGWLQAVHPEDLERWHGVWQASAAAQSPFSLDLRLRRHDGEYRWMLVSATPREPARAGGYVVSATDIHERVELEERLAERTRMLRLADRRTDRFLRLLAHELRNPLAPIANAVGMLRLMERTTPSLLSVRQIVERQLDQLTRLVNDMVDVASVTHATVALDRRPFAIADVVRSAVDSARARLDTHGHTLRIELPESPVCAVGDAQRLAQALSNLLSNAARYTLEPGVLTLRVQSDAKAIRISVKDPGQGLAAEFLPHLFEPFAQQDPHRSRSQGGLGVGLTIAKRIARLHGGELEAFSEGAGRGAEFVLSLPLDPREPLSVDSDERAYA